MIRATIDGHEVRAARGTTILEAARELRIDIPTLCHLDGIAPATFCLLCVVEETRSGRLIPSCAGPLEEGMEIRTTSPPVLRARRSVLELLLAEHVGDCEAPCQRICPAHLDVPRMIRQIVAGRLDDALVTIDETLPLAGVLGRICSAPCEKGCRRAVQDRGVSIRLLHRYVADRNLASPSPRLPGRAPSRGVRIAVIGSGPAGLSTAWHLLVKGYDCVLFDNREQPGGMLRHGVPERKLDRAVLDREIDRLDALGAIFRQRTRIGTDLTLNEILGEFAAVALTAGALDPAAARDLGLECNVGGVHIDPATCQTSHPRIFAGGDLVRLGRMAVRSVGDGRALATAIDQFVSGHTVTGLVPRFHSIVGRLHEGEIARLMQGIDPRARAEPGAGSEGGYDDGEARAECARCMGCDCRKLHSCRLRAEADRHGIARVGFRPVDRLPLDLDLSHPTVAFESGKCIRCDLCIRIARDAGDPIGLTFLGRGYGMRLGSGLHGTPAAGLQIAAEQCVRACPTGALSFRQSREGDAPPHTGA